jgi:hypothetical protein
MKDGLSASHRPIAFFAAAILLMLVGAGCALYGALAERGLRISVGGVLFCAGASLFKLSKQTPR